MKTPSPEPNTRIDLIDALRGSALAGILLLHSIEHWDFYRPPQHPAAWLRPFDTAAHDSAFSLFSGKAYAMFALVFGVSFFLILDRWSRRGVPFQGRFLWRLGILAAFGYLHGLIFCGDILLIIAVLGVPLAFLYKLGNRALAWIAVALLLQLPSIWEVGRIFVEPGYRMPQPRHWAVYGRLFDVFANGSLLDVIKTNLWTGQSSRILWTIETGRYTQMLGLFVCGLLLGRGRIFEDPARSLRVAKHALAWGVAGFAVLYPVRAHLYGWGLRDMPLNATDNLVSAYLNLAEAAVWLGAFILLYRWASARAALRLLAPYGRMSLTCYVTQALIGVPLFYNYGFAFFRWAGPFYSILIGLGILVVQAVAAHLWLGRFVYGPLEWLWRSLTFLNFSTPMRKRREARETGIQAGPPQLAMP
jgi:uncharacterized protein